VDFTVEVERSIRVLDGAVALFCAVAGVQPQSETVWRQADKYGVPRMAFVNKMDRVGANFPRVVGMMREQLRCHPVAIQIPIGAEDTFKGIVDLVEMRAVIWQGDELGAKFEVGEIPADLLPMAQEWRDKMIESLSEYDDEFATRYLEGGEFNAKEIKQHIRRATLGAKITPVLCGSAFKNKGVQPLLDAVLEYLPSPTDMPPIQGEDPRTGTTDMRRCADDEKFSALAFKIQRDPRGVDKLTFIRVYSGVLTTGSYVQNATKDQTERVGRIYLMHASTREPLEEARAGDIVALVGMKNTTTGDTLCDPEAVIRLESMSFPEPVISVAVEPKTKADQDKLTKALSRLAEEDPTFRVQSNEETGQTLIYGMGELHLEIIVDRMKREDKVDVNVGAPQVAYRETVTKVAQAQGLFKRQSGGRGQFGDVWLKVEPNDPGHGFTFKNEIVGGAIPKEFIPAVEEGVIEAMQTGPLAGYPMVDIRVTLMDGSYHEVDSNEMAFKIAGSIGFKEAAKKAGLILLEPIFKLEVITPEQYLGDVIGSLNQRRCRIAEILDRNGIKTISAMAPLGEMFGYATAVRNISSGRASFSMLFDHYEAVPKSVEEKVVGERAGVVAAAR
jgi:elongation factor G